MSNQEEENLKNILTNFSQDEVTTDQPEIVVNNN